MIRATLIFALIASAAYAHPNIKVALNVLGLKRGECVVRSGHQICRLPVEKSDHNDET